MLGVDLAAEGASLVPGGDSGRIDWSRVESVFDEAALAATATATANANAAASPDAPTTPDPDAAPDAFSPADIPDPAVVAAAASGRVGPPRVEVDRARMAGDVRLDAAGTRVASHSNFSSVRARTSPSLPESGRSRRLSVPAASCSSAGAPRDAPSRTNTAWRRAGFPSRTTGTA